MTDNISKDEVLGLSRSLSTRFTSFAIFWDFFRVKVFQTIANISMMPEGPELFDPIFGKYIKFPFCIIISIFTYLKSFMPKNCAEKRRFSGNQNMKFTTL